MSRAFYLLLATLSPGMLAAAETWVPYTAHITETVATRDANGIVNQTRNNYVEYRAIDGTVTRLRQVGGTIVSGTIWLACGDTLGLDYNRKIASPSSLPRSPRKHFVLHKEWPTLGTATMAGLTVTGWPAHVSNGTGAMWFDTANDILAKVEWHMKSANGTSTDSLTELTSIDLITPVDDSKFRLPPGFTLDSSAQGSCSGNLIQ